MTITIIKHEAVPNCDSYEVKYSATVTVFLF
jgi:hypothetical protein